MANCEVWADTIRVLTGDEGIQGLASLIVKANQIALEMAAQRNAAKSRAPEAETFEARGYTWFPLYDVRDLPEDVCIDFLLHDAVYPGVSKFRCENSPMPFAFSEVIGWRVSDEPLPYKSETLGVGFGKGGEGQPRAEAAKEDAFEVRGWVLTRHVPAKDPMPVDGSTLVLVAIKDPKNTLPKLGLGYANQFIWGIYVNSNPIIGWRIIPSD